MADQEWKWRGKRKNNNKNKHQTYGLIHCQQGVNGLDVVEHVVAVVVVVSTQLAIRLVRGHQLQAGGATTGRRRRGRWIGLH